jgi:hypothetical protein
MKVCIFKISTCLLAFDNAGTTIREGSQGFHVDNLCSHMSHSILSQCFGHTPSNASHTRVKYKLAHGCVVLRVRLCVFRVYIWISLCRIETVDPFFVIL